MTNGDYYSCVIAHENVWRIVAINPKKTISLKKGLFQKSISCHVACLDWETYTIDQVLLGECAIYFDNEITYYFKFPLLAC